MYCHCPSQFKTIKPAPEGTGHVEWCPQWLHLALRNTSTNYKCVPPRFVVQPRVGASYDDKNGRILEIYGKISRKRKKSWFVLHHLLVFNLSNFLTVLWNDPIAFRQSKFCATPNCATGYSLFVIDSVSREKVSLPLCIKSYKLWSWAQIQIILLW